jgi:hypothetical protein
MARDPLAHCKGANDLCAALPENLSHFAAIQEYVEEEKIHVGAELAYVVTEVLAEECVRQC